jgi:hypothetical protein
MHSWSRDLNLSIIYQLYKTERRYPVVNTFSYPAGPGFESRPVYHLSGRAISRAVCGWLSVLAAWVRS